MFYHWTTPTFQGVTSHLGLAEHKSESTWILSDSEALREEIALRPGMLLLAKQVTAQAPVPSR